MKLKLEIECKNNKAKNSNIEEDKIKKTNARIRYLFNILENDINLLNKRHIIYTTVVALTLITLATAVISSLKISNFNSNETFGDTLIESADINDATTISKIKDKPLNEVISLKNTFSFTKDYIIPVLTVMATALIAFENHMETAKIDSNKNILEISNKIYEIGFDLRLTEKLDTDNTEKFDNYILKTTIPKQYKYIIDDCYLIALLISNFIYYLKKDFTILAVLLIIYITISTLRPKKNKILSFLISLPIFAVLIVILNTIKFTLPSYDVYRNIVNIYTILFLVINYYNFKKLKVDKILVCKTKEKNHSCSKM